MSEILPDNTIEINQEIKEITIYSNEIIGNFVSYNDPRLVDSRNPLPHKLSHAIGGSDPLTPLDIGAQPLGDYVLENDIRLSDSRNPLGHNTSHFIGGLDPLGPLDIGAQPLGNYLTPPIIFNDLSNDSDESINIAKRVAKAWVNFNGSGTVSIRASFNISSIVDNGVGNYTINFINPFPNTNYCFVTWTRDYNNDNTLINNGSARLGSIKTVSSINLFYCNVNNGIFYDTTEFNIVFFGA